MSGLKIICAICMDVFKDSDDIATTSCGHLYHNKCIMDWQNQSAMCPPCRENNPTQHKVFLNIEDAGGSSTLDENLNINLPSTAEKIHELQAELLESKLKFCRLQKKYIKRRRIMEKLKRRTRTLQHTQNKVSEERTKVIQADNDRLSNENECLSKELDIQATAFAKGSILEQTLIMFTGQLKEISNSSQLANEKTELEDYIQEMEMQANLPRTSTHFTARHFPNRSRKSKKRKLIE